MSQVYKNLAAGPVPPTVATEYDTDVDSPAIPALNVLYVVGGSTTDDNVNGIQTDGSSGSNVLTVQLTNRVTGDTQTTNATPKAIITFPLQATPGVYEISGSVAAFDTTDVAGASYSFVSGVRTTGSAATEIGTQFTTNFEEVALESAEITISVSSNDFIVSVTGIASKTIDWDALFTYRVVS